MTPRRVLAALVAVGLALTGCSDDSGGSIDRPATTGTGGSSAGGSSTGGSSTGGSSTGGAGASAPAALGIEVLGSAPHDPSAFSQGFVFDDEGRLFESLGVEGSSAVRRVDPDTGEVLHQASLPDDEFGEGLAIGPDGLVQLTWKDGVAHRWTLDLEPLGDFSYDGEGWGLTFDGDHFVQSDGSGVLTVRDPDDFSVVRRVEVTRDGRPADELNELEWVDGVVYANVWHSDEILRIDPDTGAVTGVVDASALWQHPARTSEMTLNGIAHRPGDPPDELWLTGKNWPEVHRVRVVPT